MSVPKVDKEKTQVKLVFGEIEAGQFPLDRLMEEMHLEFHAFATSAGVLVMKALMEAEEKHLAGERQSHETEVNRWGKQPGSVLVGVEGHGIPQGALERIPPCCTDKR